ncbi:MAG: hypothetical protein MUD13_05885 [Candidatus Nanopelagicales bacterium]|nr:hypothetical protein [Candidatus Nanopelagicales bacterium]
MEVVPVLTVLFLLLVLTCLMAPWFGADSSDARSERARPEHGWYPGIQGR